MRLTPEQAADLKLRKPHLFSGVEVSGAAAPAPRGMPAGLKPSLTAPDEKQMHEQFIQWLRMREIPYIHSRMDRKSTIQEGHPDFTMLWHGKGFCIEFKREGYGLTGEQMIVIEGLQRAGVVVSVFRDVAEAIRWTQTMIVETP